MDPHADLQRGISVPRFQTFLNAANAEEGLARRLYVWNRDLSVAFLADIAILEVALRNAMHDAATAAWDPFWYADLEVTLDDRSAGQLSRAWGYLHESVRSRPRSSDVPGRLVAQCMFGFWTNLLDAGGYSGKQPRRIDADYESLWTSAFMQAFPGGRPEARRQRQANSSASPTFTRAWVHSVCKNVNDLRNRVAHHEPIINGFPLNGQRTRMTASEAHDECLKLARMLDRDLAKWLEANSYVPRLLSSRPC